MSKKSLLEDDEIWNFPVRPTVLESEIRGGLKRAFGGAPDVMPSPHGGGKKMAAGLQDFIMGLAQVAGAPVTSALSPAAPLIDKAMNYKFEALPPHFRKLDTPVSIQDTVEGFKKNVTDPIADAVGYDKGRAQELGLTGLSALAGGFGRGAGKLLPMKTEGVPTRNTFISANQVSNLPKFARENLHDAMALEASGFSPAEIFRDTGWLRHPLDKDWRFEISDADAKLKMNVKQMDDLRQQEVASGTPVRVPTKDVLDHPLLYEMLPEMAQIPMTFQRSRGSNFRFNSMVLPRPGGKQFEPFPAMPDRHIGQATIGTRDENAAFRQAGDIQLMDHILHEVAGHGVQRRNPAATYGSNSELAGGYENYVRNAGEIEANLLGRRKYLDPDHARTIYPYSDSMNDLVMDPAHSVRSPFINSEMQTHGRTSAQQVDAWDNYLRKLGILTGTKVIP